MAISLFVATYIGVGFEYLWSEYPGWNRDALYVFAGLTVAFAALFTRSFLEMESTAPRLDKILLAVAGGGLLSGVVGYVSIDWGDRLSYASGHSC